MRPTFKSYLALHNQIWIKKYITYKTTCLTQYVQIYRKNSSSSEKCAQKSIGIVIVDSGGLAQEFRIVAREKFPPRRKHLSPGRRVSGAVAQRKSRKSRRRQTVPVSFVIGPGRNCSPSGAAILPPSRYLIDHPTHSANHGDKSWNNLVRAALCRIYKRPKDAWPGFTGPWGCFIFRLRLFDPPRRLRPRSKACHRFDPNDDFMGSNVPVIYFRGDAFHSLPCIVLGGSIKGFEFGAKVLLLWRSFWILESDWSIAPGKTTCSVLNISRQRFLVLE